MFSLLRNLCIFITISILYTSCVPQKKVVYVQSKGDKKEYNYLVESKRNIKIEPLDLLYISIESIDQPNYNFLSHDKQTFNSITETSLTVFGYTVSDSGFIQLPVIGKIKLQGLTLDEATHVIKNRTVNFLSNPIVSVRFVNNSVTVLGEVQRPGTHTYSKQQLTLLSALGLAGDITEYGNRRNVVLIREKNKTIHKYYLDLTKDDIFKSDYYYLRPNDILYIEPLKIRRFGMKDYPFSLIISSITSAFLILNYFKN